MTNAPINGALGAAEGGTQFMQLAFGVLTTLVL